MGRREREAEAVATLHECRRALAAKTGTILAEVTGTCGFEVADWQRYPEGEVYDPVSHAQYFYHRHGAADRTPPDRREPDEHGHFHLFLRAEGIPAGITPLLLPELAVANAPAAPQSAPAKRSSRDEVAHLVAIALDRQGEPIRLFTTNRWVTGESWYCADDIIAMLDCFEPRGGGASELLNRWLGAVVCLFQPEIAVLLRNRDKAIAEWRWRRRSHVFEDPRLEITSSFAIDLDARLAAVERGAASANSGGNATSHGLPRMAEGWGV